MSADTILFTENSLIDLVLRGFSREAILEQTGEDVGYNGLAVSRPAKHINRSAYREAHIRERVGIEVLHASFDDIARDSAGVPELIEAVGLGVSVDAIGTVLKAMGEYPNFVKAKRQATASRREAQRPEWTRVERGEHDLYPSGSVLDLGMLGFTQAEILERTGVDVGYHGSKLKVVLMNADRQMYQFAHVTHRVRQAQLDELLADYAAGVSDCDVFCTGLGFGSGTRPRLRDLFRYLGRADEFAALEGTRRKAFMVGGMIEAYGVDNAFKLEKFQQKAGDTREAQFGGRYTFSAESSLRDQAVATFAKNMSDSEFRAGVIARRRETMGVDHPFALPGVLERAREKAMAKYGVSHHAKTPEARAAQSKLALENSAEWVAKSKETSLARYGVPHYGQTAEARAAMSERMRDPVNQRRALETKKANGTVKESAPETWLYEELVAVFGVKDVVRQHRDEARYPFACDFYIPSRDLFVELNGSWTHGGHWYDPEVDSDLVCTWQAKNSAYCDNAIGTWTQRDVAKRQAAQEHGLNYVVLWDGSEKMLDVKLWLTMGCPDGQDWRVEYSWLPVRELDLDGQWPSELPMSTRKTVALARRANWREFYRRELALWADNPVRPRRWGTVQVRLYANRREHQGKARGTGKLPGQLTDLEILRGLSISGELRGFTVFDNAGMVAVLDEYEPTSVYDPCAGWGERLVTCAARGITYRGVDVNAAVVAGHQQIIEQYGLTEQTSVVADASTYDASEGTHEMVFTCPPYGGIEQYTAGGAETLDDADFLAWWAHVVDNSVSASTQVFAYQINERYREAMNAVVSDAGFVWAGEVSLAAKSSHFTRSPGVNRKRERESVQVFERG